MMIYHQLFHPLFYIAFERIGISQSPFFQCSALEVFCLPYNSLASSENCHTLRLYLLSEFLLNILNPKFIFAILTVQLMTT